MKGFLNKVQTKVTGGKNGGEGKPVAAADGKAGATSNNGIEVTPKADILLPKKHDRRRASLSRHNKMVAIKELSLLSETPMLKRE
eukprot:gene13655-17303_t